MQPQIRMPRIGTSGTHGVRNGRGRSGLRVAQHDDAGADDDEREQRADGHQFAEQADREQAGDRPRPPAPVTIVAMYGVRNFGCTLPKTGGSRPSRDIE